MRPEERDPASLWDMRQAAADIGRFLDSKTYEAFVADDLLVRAVERLLSVIGEAARRVSTQFREEHPAFPWRRMIALRNLLMHQYEDVNLPILWEIATSDVPALIDLIDGTGLLDE